MKINLFRSMSIAIIFFYCSSLFSTTNFKNQNLFYYNKFDNFIDSSIHYWTDANKGFVGIGKEKLLFQFRKFDNDTLIYRSVELVFLNQIDTLPELFGNMSKQFQYVAQNSSANIIYNEVLDAYENIMVENLYKGISFTFNLHNLFLNLQFNCTKNYDVSKLKFTISGLDSIKYVSPLDSSLKCFYNDDYFIINKLTSIQTDTLGDTTIISNHFIISNDTISIGFVGLDTNKTLVLESIILDSTSYNNNEDYSIISDEYILDDKLHLISENESKNKCTFIEREVYINDYLRNLDLDSNYKFLSGYNRSYEYHFLDIYGRHINERTLARFTLADSIKFLAQESDNFNRIVVVLETFKELNCGFKNKLVDTLNFKYQDSSSNLALFYINSLGELSDSYYLRLFDSSELNIQYHVSDIFIKNYNIYLLGSGIFNFNDSILFSQNYLDNFINTSSQKSFILQFNTFYNSFINNAYFGHSGNTGEFIHFNTIIPRFDKELERDVFFIGGLTNSTNILNDSLWDKNSGDVDNFIIKIGYNLDTIYKAVMIGGSSSEFKIVNSNDYLKCKNFLSYIGNDRMNFWGQTNSNNFFNTNGTNIIKNTKIGNDYDIFSLEINNNVEIKKLLFYDSSEDDELSAVKLYEGSFYVLVRTKSDDFQMANELEFNSIDSISMNTTYQKGFLFSIDQTLFLGETLNYALYSSSFIESTDSNLMLSENIIINFNNIFLGVNVKSENLILTSEYNLNFGYNNIKYDGCLIKINRR